MKQGDEIILCHW